MVRSFTNKILITICALLFAQVSFAQSDVYSEIYASDYNRLQQLINDSNKAHSFAIRSSSLYFNQSQNKKASFQLNNIGFEVRNNNNLGMSSNDGSMLPSVGFEQRAHINVSANYGKFYLQLAPEFYSAQNKEPQPFSLDPQDGNYMARYYMYEANQIDMFSRFGKEKISKPTIGQSSFSFHTKTMSVGVSSENLWWGPGIRNSLVLSNNATGFLHASIHTLHPIKTDIGSFEGQIIFGKLENSGFENPDNERMRSIWAGGIAIKDTSKRTIAGAIISWTPKWLTNFYIGMAMAGTSYTDGLDRKLVAFPFSSSYKPIKLGSFFMRYVMPKDKAEIYIELGRADKMASPFNIMKDSIPMGYTAGIRKLVSLNNKGSYFYAGLELTRLQLPDPRLIFTQGDPFGAPQTNSWYLGKEVKQGYTNNAEVLGARIGPGSNSQTLQLGYIKGYKKIMLSGERVSHNNDFYYYNYYNGSINSSKFWVDLSATLQIQWDYKNLLFSAGATTTKLLNYRWIKLDGGFSGPSKLSDRKNSQLYASMVWFFKGL